MNSSSLPTRQAAFFALICTLLPSAYLVLWLSDVHPLLDYLTLVAFTAWGPAFPIMNALGWFSGPSSLPHIVNVVVALTAWFLVAFCIHLLVRKTWIALILMIAIAVLSTLVNFLVILPYL